jgi:hypothetical protein
MMAGKTNDTEGLTFSGHINNSPFFRNRFGDSKLYVGIYNYPTDPSLFLLHEAYRFWENKPGITNFIPHTDVQIDTVLELIHNSHKQRFGEYKMDYTFPVQYDFNTGPKLTFVKTIEILGCTYEYFKIYIESKFEDWMNWENQGKYNGELNFGWDMDHIIPISSAKNEEEIYKLNH